MVRATYNAGRAVGKRVGSYVAKNYLSNKRGPGNTWRVQPQRKRPRTQPKRTEMKDEIAQADIGYGSHEARRMFTSRGKRRYSRKKKAIMKRSKRFTKKVHKALNSRYPYQKTIIDSVQQMGTLADKQNMYLGTIATSNFGDGGDVKEIRENDLFNIMNQQAVTGSYDIRDKQIKWRLENYTWNCWLRNMDSDPIQVEVHQMVCKKSMKGVLLEGDNPSTEWVATQPANIQTWLFTVQPHSEKDESNVFVTPAYDTLGVKPTDLTMIEKYFKTEKVDRYEMAAGTQMNFSRKFHIKKSFKPVDITNHTTIAGVTRLFVFVMRGFPVRSDTINYAASSVADENGGLIIHQSRVYNWRNDWDSYSRLTSGQQGEQFKTISYCAYGSTLLGGQQSTVTS